MTTRMLIWAALTVVFLAGCEAESPSPAERAARPTPTTPPVPPSPRVPPSPAPPARPAQPTPDLQRLEEALAEAAQRAEGETEDDARPDCERAFEDVQALLRSFAAHQKAPAATPTMPDRADFIRTCESLPEDAQRCMRVSYSMRNVDECRRVREGLSPEHRERLGRLAQPPG